MIPLRNTMRRTIIIAAIILMALAATGVAAADSTFRMTNSVDLARLNP